MIATRNTIWTLGNGKTVNVEIRVNRELVERVINADGDVIHTGIMDPTSYTSITATVDGTVIASGALEIARANTQGVVSNVGKLGIKAEQDAIVRALVAEAEAEATSPEYAARIQQINAAEIKAAQVDAEYADHVRKVDGMMTLNGRSY
jgi:adhesin HecA-like repeat protein